MKTFGNIKFEFVKFCLANLIKDAVTQPCRLCPNGMISTKVEKTGNMVCFGCFTLVFIDDLSWEIMRVISVDLKQRFDRTSWQVQITVESYGLVCQWEIVEQDLADHAVPEDFSLS